MAILSSKVGCGFGLILTQEAHNSLSMTSGDGSSEMAQYRDHERPATLASRMQYI